MKLDEDPTVKVHPNQDQVELARKKKIISQYIEEESVSLIKSFSILGWKTLGQGHDITSFAQELLSEVTGKALEKADSFDPGLPVGPWLYGFARNLVKQHRTQVINWRERSSYTLAENAGYASEADYFDNFSGMCTQDFTEGLVNKDSFRPAFEAALQCLSVGDRTILDLALLKQLNGEEIAQALQLAPGTARVKLHRAISRVRDQMLKQGWKQED